MSDPLDDIRLAILGLDRMVCKHDEILDGSPDHPVWPTEEPTQSEEELKAVHNIYCWGRPDDPNPKKLVTIAPRRGCGEARGAKKSRHP